MEFVWSETGIGMSEQIMKKRIKDYRGEKW